MHVAALIPVKFRFPGGLAPNARRVAVVGSFNGWDPSAHPLVQSEGEDWTATHLLPPGRLIYGFWVDGMMWLDPEDEGRVPNAWGSEYSVRTIHPDDASPHARSA